MPKYHVNAKGEVGPCSATMGGCPFGGESGSEHHYESRQEAQAWAFKKLEEEFGGSFGAGSLATAARTLNTPFLAPKDEGYRSDNAWVDAATYTSHNPSDYDYQMQLRKQIALVSAEQGAPMMEAYTMKTPLQDFGGPPVNFAESGTWAQAYENFEKTKAYSLSKNPALFVSQDEEEREKLPFNSNPFGVSGDPHEMREAAKLGYMPIGGGLYAAVSRSQVTGPDGKLQDDPQGTTTVQVVAYSYPRHETIVDTTRGAHDEVLPLTASASVPGKFREVALMYHRTGQDPSTGRVYERRSFNTPSRDVKVSEWRGAPSDLRNNANIMGSEEAKAKARSAAQAQLYSSNPQAYQHKMAMEWQQKHPLKARVLKVVAKGAGALVFQSIKRRERAQALGGGTPPNFMKLSATLKKSKENQAFHSAFVRNIGYPGVKWGVKSIFSISQAIAEGRY